MTERDLNFELLRILSIISIVVGHMGAVGKGVFSPLTYLGDVNCFVLISGYFLINSKFKAIRVVRLFVETIFYCFIISFIFALTTHDVSVGTLIKSAFPFAPTKFSYWFINKFLALLLLQPFLVCLVKQLNKKQFKYLLIILYLINSEFVMFFPFAKLFNNGFSLPWMITVFLTGGYIKLYNPFSRVSNWGGYWILSSICFYLAVVFGGTLFQLGYNNWIFMAKSVSMFMWVRSITIPYSSIIGKIIAFISPHVLSIYLIHSQNLLCNWLIDKGVSLSIYDESYYTLLLWSGYGILIILSCVLIDKVRILIFKKIGILSYLTGISSRIDSRIEINDIHRGNVMPR